MDIRRNLWRLPAGGALLLVAGAGVAGVLLSRSGGASGTAATAGSPPSVPPPAADPSLTLTLSVKANAAGQPIPSGFLGFSFEFQAVRAYTGSNPRRINPVLVQLIR